MDSWKAKDHNETGKTRKRSGRDPENRNDFEQEKAEVAEIEAIKSKIWVDFLSPDEGAAVFL